MAKAAPKPCRAAGCSKVVAQGYCDRHKHHGWEAHQRGKSTTDRGYGHAWRQLRMSVLERDRHLCQECKRSKATEVDHKVSKAAGGTDAMDNLQSICRPCHLSKTAREQRA